MMFIGSMMLPISNGYGRNCFVKNQQPNQFTTSFKFVNGLILVEAKLNGKKGWFILDSGAPDLVINTAHYNGKLHTSKKNATGATGRIAIKETTVTSFEWNGFKLQDYNAIAFDQTHLERPFNLTIVGLIGAKLIQDYEMFIDYEKRKLTLFKKGYSKYHQQIKPTHTIPFTLSRHLATINVKIKGQTYTFQLDTGAMGNTLSEKILDKLSEKDDYQLLGTIPLAGAGKKLVQAKRIALNKFKTNTLAFDKMGFIVMNIARLQKRLPNLSGGVLGFPFLSSKKRVSINYKTQQIHFWE